MSTTIIPDYRDENGKWVKSKHMHGSQYFTVSVKKWQDMRDRCNPNSRVWRVNPSYTGCTMSPLFADFQTFTDWHTGQIGYGQGYQLDKDFLVKGNKLYSEETCLLIPQPLNAFLTDHAARRGYYPQGVSLHACGKFQSYISGGTRTSQKHLGLFNTVEEAASAYATAKTLEAKNWLARLEAGEFKVDPRLLAVLREWEFKHESV